MSKSFSSTDSSSYDFGNDPLGSVGGEGSVGSGNMSDLQRVIMQEQEKALIQQAIGKITALAWDKCITGRPDSSLSDRESKCIKNTTLNYLDTSMFITQRLMRPASPHGH